MAWPGALQFLAEFGFIGFVASWLNEHTIYSAPGPTLPPPSMMPWGKRLVVR
jgi:hypothetical protein